MAMVSEFVRFGVVDQAGRRARLVDAAVDLAAGDYPPVRRLIFRDRAKRQSELPWEAVRSVDWHKRQIVVGDLLAARAAPPAALTRSVLLKRDLMDALVVDVAHRQTTRANDLWLRESQGRLQLAGADVSPWAVVRRVGRGWLGRGAERRLLDWKDVEFLRGHPDVASAGQDYHRRITQLQPPEIAHLLDELPYLHAAELLSIIPDPLAADTLEAMTAGRQAQVVDELDDGQVARLLELMAPDAAADLLGGIEPRRVERLVAAIGAEQRKRVLDLLRFPADTAGGIMTNHLPLLPATLTVAAARRILRDQLVAPDFVYYIYIVDDLGSGHLKGVVTLREFELADDDQLVADIIRADVSALDPLQPAIEAARRVADQHLSAMPVLAKDGRLLGAVTIDAAVRQIAPAGWGKQAPRVFS
ncbi:MAG: magnesium transporter MgtE N-terminal domain-containing protein [Chloroflexota bacterium]